MTVDHVDHDSTAWHPGLRKGDTILELNRERIEDLRSLAALSRQAGRGLLLRVRRGDRSLLLVAR